LVKPTMAFKTRPDLFLAGQIVGVEGYVGNAATGLVAAVNLTRHLSDQSEWVLPVTTMLGALCHYVTHAEPQHFQPMKANFGVFPELAEKVKNKRDRYNAYADRALQDMKTSIETLSDPILSQSAISPVK
jgi:methylenetetrahydrofolate--tRNA-(uracil-5-)-methyltransferase